MKDWLTGLEVLNRGGDPAVLVTVVETQGSAPREAGARMTVGAGRVFDTIGGGQLEHAAIESARLLLEDGGEGYTNTLERHALSPRLGQCCGGVSRLLLERIPAGAHPWIDALLEARRDRALVFTATPLGGAGKQAFARLDELTADALDGDARAPAARAMEAGKPVFDRRAGWYIEPVPPPELDVVLFGAGHVGTALAEVLATLPCSLTWIDSRGHLFPDVPLPNVRTEIVQEPETAVEDCPRGAFYLVMTHSHQRDFDICERILVRGDFAYCGLIGSRAKRRSCEKKLRLKGITETMLNRLTCPIGVAGIGGKRPAEIAVAAAAEVLQVRERIRVENETTPPGSGALAVKQSSGGA